jgi:HK97 family phage major capsid protein
MNLKDLIAKRNELLGTVNTKLDEANGALSEGNVELAKSLQSEADDYAVKAEVYAGQIKAVQAAQNAEQFTVDEPAATDADEPKTKSAPVRMPFDTADTDEPNDEKLVTKAVHLVKYGDVPSQVKALASDLYGADYMQKRYDQQKAFVKYVRTGRIDREQESLLKTLIMTPEQIARDIVEDTDYASIKATLNETINELGGYLVPEDYRAQMVKKIADTGFVRRFARKVTTSRDSIEWPKLLGGDDRYTSGVRVTWVDENPSDESVAETNPTFGMVRIPVHTVMARIDMSRNQLEDSAFNMVSMMTELFGEAAGIDEDVQFISGTGGNTPRGILGARSGATLVPLTGIETVDSGASSTLQPDGIIDLVYDLPQQYRRNAIVMANRLSHRDIRKFKDADNQYLWEPSMQAGEPARILGYPIYENESLPTVAANAYPVIFGDFSGYVIVDRIGMSVERVTDTLTTGKNKVALFMRRRLGGDLIEPWKFKVQKVSA